MSNPFLGEAIAKGGADIEDNRARKAEARQRQASATLSTKVVKETADDQVSLAVAQLQNELFATQAEGLQQQTYAYIDKFESDRDFKHLNNFLTKAKTNSLGKEFYGDFVRIDPISRTPEVVSTLEEMGVVDIDGFFEDPSIAANYAMVTSPDGSQQMYDLDTFYGMTGYADYADDKTLTRMKRRAEILEMLKGGHSVKNLTAAERVAREWAENSKESDEPISFVDAYKQLTMKSGVAGTGGTQMERYAAALMKEDPSLSFVSAMQRAVQEISRGTEAEREARVYAKENNIPYKQAFDEVTKRRERTTDQKSFDEVIEVKDALDEAFGGSFLDADLTVPANRSKAGRLMARIEKDHPMSAADRKIAVEIRQLTAMADKAGEGMTDEIAGPLDSLFRDVRKYLSNSTKGLDTTAAYEAYRNTMRHALFGSAQTAQEGVNFTRAMGSLYQQAGPVLMQFKTQTEELKAKLEAVYDLNDEYVAKYRLGMSLDKIASVIAAMDDRLEMFDSVVIPDFLEAPSEAAITQTVEDYAGAAKGGTLKEKVLTDVNKVVNTDQFKDEQKPLDLPATEFTSPEDYLPK